MQISLPLFPSRMLMALLLCILCLSAATVHAMDANGIQVERNKGTIVRLPGFASVVAVADPTIADVEVLAPDLISLQGRGVGQTSIVAFNAAGDEILNETVTVSHNITTLKRILGNVLPDNEVTFDSVDGALVMSGTVASPLEADNIRRVVEPFLGTDQLVNMLNIEGSDQVLLKVRVAEISRSELKRFGINLASVLDSGSFAFGLVTGRDISGGNAANIVRGSDNNNLAIDYSGGNLSLNSVIDALADDNLIKVLAEPSLTTASGRSANFLAGGEYPIPVPGQNGQVTIEYREYGVGLNFTPLVLSKDKISLTVAPEVSELSQIGAVELQGFTIPSLVTRRAETTVELGSGQSFAIAGLLQHSNSNNVTKFPFLGDMPILGALFRSTEFQQDESELMILVTPYIVRGVNAAELTDPTEGFTPPTDPERILLGNTYTPKPEPKPARLEGTPSDLRNPSYRRKMAEQNAGRLEAPREAMTPAPSVVKTPPAPEQPTQAPPAAQTPAKLNGPIGYRLR